MSEESIIERDICAIMKSSYADYAMSVIMSRALPDIRDGLKPVHRRIIYSMYNLSLDYNKPHKKSARVVGDTIGKYHPHGDVAVYDSMVRMAQDFSMRYPLINGQGNFGSIDGDSPAAMRYTEVRMEKITREFVTDLDRETVEMVPNYDEKEMEPTVLPVTFPHLLINGASGIAVGMSTNIPPHNMRNVIEALLLFIKDPAVEDSSLISLIEGPDFPTGGKIMGIDGIISSYILGAGRIVLRGKYHIEERRNKQVICITEIPYQVNKAKLIERIGFLSKERKIEGISSIVDESDKTGMCIAITVKSDYSPQVIVNRIIKETSFQIAFSVNNVALVDGVPKRVGLREFFTQFFKFRKEVVFRRSLFELRKAEKRRKVLEAISVSLENIDTVIALIKGARNASEAVAALTAREWGCAATYAICSELMAPEDIGFKETYTITEEQAQNILDMKLQRLTSMEISKIKEEYSEILQHINFHNSILRDRNKLVGIIISELEAIITAYGDERRTEIDYNDNGEVELVDAIREEERIISISVAGYIKSQGMDEFIVQNRGGKGKIATKNKEDDYLAQIITASNKDAMLFFSSTGRVYSKKIYTLPDGSRNSRGKPISNIIEHLSPGERITALMNVANFATDGYAFLTTQKGVVKKVDLEEFGKIRANGTTAINLDDGDKLVNACIVANEDSAEEIILITREGMGIRFETSQIRSTGKNSRGVRGARLADGDDVVSVGLIENENQKIIIVTENGYGKISSVAEYRSINRGGKGVRAIAESERNGKVVGAAILDDTQMSDVMIATEKGMLIRIDASEIKESGRVTQGVRLVRLNDGDRVSSIQVITSI